MCNKDKQKEESIALHKQCNDELRFFKQQQWKVTYYCLLLLVALVAIPEQYRDSLNLQYYIWVILIAGALLLLDIQRSLYRHRNIRDAIKEDFEPKTKAYLKASDKNLFKYIRRLYKFMTCLNKIKKWFLKWLYCLVFIVVLGIACWIVSDIVAP